MNVWKGLHMSTTNSENIIPVSLQIQRDWQRV